MVRRIEWRQWNCVLFYKTHIVFHCHFISHSCCWDLTECGTWRGRLKTCWCCCWCWCWCWERTIKSKNLGIYKGIQVESWARLHCKCSNLWAFDGHRVESHYVWMSPRTSTNTRTSTSILEYNSELEVYVWMSPHTSVILVSYLYNWTTDRAKSVQLRISDQESGKKVEKE